MGRFLARRRFNVIDALGMVLIALAGRDENWLAAIVIAALFPLASTLAESAQGDRNE